MGTAAPLSAIRDLRMQDITHLFFALALAYVLDLPVVYAMIGGLVPDADLWVASWLPITHRGIMHTPVFVLFSTTILYLVSNRRQVAYALGVGMLSHLYLDTLTPMGIRWLYPVLTEQFTLNIVRAANPAANIAMSVFFIAVMLGWRYQTRVVTWIRP